VSKLEVIHLPVASLRPYSRNARTHSQKQITQIAASIRTFGFNNPVLIDKDGVIIAGHGRVAAAKSLGLESVPVIRLEHMSEAEKRAYILADNKLAEKAGWDSDILAIELQNLMELDLDFDISITGFEMPEIDVLISGPSSKPEKADPLDAVPALAETSITRPGDIWRIGPHRLICGNALEREIYTRLLGGEQAQMVFTDPPYKSPASARSSTGRVHPPVPHPRLAQGFPSHPPLRPARQWQPCR
jgi:ParB-like chromosome segregation protein Spo0J